MDKEGDEVKGIRTSVEVIKNKTGLPYRNTTIDLINGEGVKREGEILAMGEEKGIILRATAWYRYGDINLGKGYEEATNYLKENKDIQQELLDKINSQE